MSQTSKYGDTETISISFITCGPGNEVYSLYGHTAIRYKNPMIGADYVINYGIFDFNQKNFILKFLFGITDYQMGIIPFSLFKKEYTKERRWVIEQQLNLTTEEKLSIINAIEKNYQPKNRIYRYNFFYDNCTTHARNIISDNIGGKIIYRSKAVKPYSYRELIHQWNKNERWARFGNDLLLGYKADKKTTFKEQQFLPINLYHDFQNALIKHNNGNITKLVSNKQWIIPPIFPSSHEYWFTPTICFILIGLTIVLTTVVEIKSKKNYWIFDLLLFLLTGTAGLILLAMIFSQHPTVSVNFQILLLNPLSLFLIYPTIKSFKSRKGYWWISGWILCIIIFFFTAIIQTFAEGMIYLALSLLLRYSVKKRYILNK